jgi:glycosyltransferase involved in cell wall biosynthesis
MSIQVTVGIVARNEEDYISQTLESLINQDFSHEEFEIMVVDGNSEDNTREIASEILEESNISYKILNENDYGSSGLCFARNLVIDHSNTQSKYIAFTDADCILAKDWLTQLFRAIERSDNKIVGAGGPRLIAPTTNKKEMVINAFITSLIASGGNPAFSKRKIKFLNSIPNYNAIYKKDIISNFRYEEELVFSDDHELNYRMHMAGYLFKYTPSARVYHRETSSILQFAKNMFRYGFMITNLVRKHRLLKIKMILTLIFLFYLIFILPLFLIWGYLAMYPLIFYLIFALISFGEVLLTTRTFYAFIVFLLLPVQHIAYALGVFFNFISK